MRAGGRRGCGPQAHLQGVHVNDGRILPRPCSRRGTARTSAVLCPPAGSGGGVSGGKRVLAAAQSAPLLPAPYSRARASARVAPPSPEHCGRPKSSGPAGALQLGPVVVTAPHAESGSSRSRHSARLPQSELGIRRRAGGCERAQALPQRKGLVPRRASTRSPAAEAGATGHAGVAGKAPAPWSRASLPSASMAPASQFT